MPSTRSRRLVRGLVTTSLPSVPAFLFVPSCVIVLLPPRGSQRELLARLQPASAFCLHAVWPGRFLTARLVPPLSSESPVTPCTRTEQWPARPRFQHHLLNTRSLSLTGLCRPCTCLRPAWPPPPPCLGASPSHSPCGSCVSDGSAQSPRLSQTPLQVEPQLLPSFVPALHTCPWRVCSGTPRT